MVNIICSISKCDQLGTPHIGILGEAGIYRILAEKLKRSQNYPQLWSITCRLRRPRDPNRCGDQFDSDSSPHGHIRALYHSPTRIQRVSIGRPCVSTLWPRGNFLDSSTLTEPGLSQRADPYNLASHDTHLRNIHVYLYIAQLS